MDQLTRCICSHAHPLDSCRMLRPGAQCALVRPLPPVRTMSKSPASEKRLLPGWARVVLLVWGIAMLLLLMQYLVFAAMLGMFPD
jgi:hypothetical protein